MKVSLTRRGLCITSKRGSVVCGVTNGRLIFTVGIWRTHVWTTPIGEKISYWMNHIFPGFGRLEARQRDLRCLAICVPGPIGTFWWFGAQGSTQLRSV